MVRNYCLFRDYEMETVMTVYRNDPPFAVPIGRPRSVHITVYVTRSLVQFAIRKFLLSARISSKHTLRRVYYRKTEKEREKDFYIE